MTTQSGWPGLKIYDAENTTDLPGTLILSEGLTTQDAAANNAYANLSRAARYFEQVHDRDSVDDRGMALIASVHYGPGNNDAFWNGTQFVFGDGDGRNLGDLASSPDLAVGEFTKAVITYSAALEYGGQSGALTDSLGDAFAVAARSDASGWLIGQGLFLADPTAGLRSLEDPARYGQAATMSDYDDSKGIQVNAGIPGNAFYRTASAVGRADAGRIWYVALTEYSGPTTDFAGFARATTRAATDLHGPGSTQVDRTEAAWKAVGVN